SAGPEQVSTLTHMPPLVVRSTLFSSRIHLPLHLLRRLIRLGEDFGQRLTHNFRRIITEYSLSAYVPGPDPSFCVNRKDRHVDKILKNPIKLACVSLVIL